MNYHRSRSWLLLVPLLLLTGCQGGDEIKSYQVDRLKQREPERLLGAIIPRPGGENWFFKFVGPASVVAEHQKEFHKLIHSVRPGDKEDSPLTWILPDDWKQEPGDEFRVATLCFGPGQGLELAVSRFGGSLLDNVNRWLEERGHKAVSTEKELREQKIIEDLRSNGLNIVLVDVTGGGGRARRMGMAPRAVEADEPAEPKYTLPKDWKQVKPTSPFTRVAIRLPDSQEKNPEVTISALKGDGGGLLANYQRWQKQLGLKEASELPKDRKTIEVAGEKIPYFDLSAPEGKDQQRILVAVFQREGFTWFFKLQARSEQAGKQQTAFEAFVKSVRF